MNLLKIDCKDKLKKVINIMKRGDGDFEFILASELIKRKHLPKKASVTLGKILIPPINIINNYLATGKERKYEREYMSHLSRPEILSNGAWRMERIYVSFVKKMNWSISI